MKTNAIKTTRNMAKKSLAKLQKALKACKGK